MASANENLTLTEWLVEMLSRRQLGQPDGRHLYQYRLKDAEFLDLENILKLHIAEWRFYYNFMQISQRPGFSALFVLYGAEWWRRRYDGSGFSWEPILDNLGVFNNEWNASNRSDCVREGLRRWKLQALNSGFKFLGSVAVEGGLPMKPLAQARGGIGNLLGRILRMANNRLVTPEDIEEWITTLQAYLPKSYRQPAIFTLLTEVAWTVLTLKKQAALDSGKDAVARLDEKIPDWRNRFPLPIEDRHARALIEQLVREAAIVRLQKSAVCLPVERFLENDMGEWTFSSNINLPETIETQKIAGLFKIEPDDFPPFAELSVKANDKQRITKLRKMVGSGAIRIDDAAWGFSGNYATAEHLLRLSANDGRSWTVSAAKGQNLDDDLPWLFSDDNNSYRFICQGSGGVPDDNAVIALPSGWKICDEFSAFGEKIGVLQNPAREIFNLNDTVMLEDLRGNRCKIAVKSIESEQENYEWQGRRWWLDFVSPAIAFRGKPKLYRVSETGHSFSVNSGINCSGIGSSGANLWLGPVWLTFSANGEIKQKTKMVLLPEDAALSLKPRDALSGCIMFENCDLSEVFVSTDNVNFTRRKEGSLLNLEVSVSAEHRAPDQITVELFWRHSSSAVRLRLPFPSKGTRAFDGKGREIAADSMLSINQLFGVRLSILSGGMGRNIKLKLQTEDGRVVRNFKLKPLSETVSLELKLTDYLTDLEHLLSLNDSPDAKVKAVVLIENDVSFALDIARYSAVLEKKDEYVCIKTENRFECEIESSVYAFRLEDTNSEPSALEIGESAEEEKSKWLFAPETREPGAWLIFPAKESQMSFRPTLWTIAGELQLESQFAQAAALADITERKKALNKLVVELANDFSHPCWEEICRFAAHLGHLPLTTLDIWRRFAHSTQGMAALAFRLHKLPKGFVSRFEKELPFAWEVIPFRVWKNAIRQAFEHSVDIYGGEVGKMLFANHVENRINILAANHGGLSYLLGIASVEFFPEKNEDLQRLRQVGGYLSDSLFSGENGALMKLRRILDDWENDKDGILRAHWENPEIARFLYTEDLRFQNDIINTPLLLAAESATGKSKSWLQDPAKIHLLRTFRAFSPEWFDEAYNITIVRCLADGLLDA